MVRDSYIRMRILHRLNPKLQFENDIFDVKTRCKVLSFALIFKMVFFYQMFLLSNMVSILVEKVL